MIARPRSARGCGCSSTSAPPMEPGRFVPTSGFSAPELSLSRLLFSVAIAARNLCEKACSARVVERCGSPRQARYDGAAHAGRHACLACLAPGSPLRPADSTHSLNVSTGGSCACTHPRAIGMLVSAPQRRSGAQALDRFLPAVVACLSVQRTSQSTLLDFAAGDVFKVFDVFEAENVGGGVNCMAGLLGRRTGTAIGLAV